MSKVFHFKKFKEVSNEAKKEGLGEGHEHIIKIDHDDLKNEIINNDYKFRDEYIIDDCDDEMNFCIDYDSKSEDLNDFDEYFCDLIINLINYITKNDKSIKQSNVKDILNNIYATKSTKPDIFSYHVYFPMLRIKLDEISILRSIISSFISEPKNRIKNNSLDINIYKKNTSLRFPYSYKNDNSNYYHKIIKIDLHNKYIYDDHYDTIGLNKVDFTKYSIKLKNENSISLNLDNYSKKKSKILLPLFDDISNFKKLNKESPYSTIKIKEIFHIIFGSIIYDVKIRNGNILIIDYNDDDCIGDLPNQIMFTLDYSKITCPFCSKSSHKSKHFITFSDKGFMVNKTSSQDNSKLIFNNFNCKSKEYYYNYSLYNFIDFLTNIGRIKVCHDNIIIFSNDDGWNISTPKLNMSIIFKKILTEYKDILIDKHFDSLFKLSEKMIEESILCKKSKLEIVKYNNETFKFKNGILNIIDDKFYEFKDSKDIININPFTDYDFKDFKDFNNIDKIKYKELKGIIEDLIPKRKKNGIINDERIWFDIMCGECLKSENRELLIIFRGPGAVGKTTILSIIESVFSSKNVAEIKGESLEKNSKNNSSSADPFIANMNMKPLVRIRELKNIDEDVLKIFTGYKQAARKLYSGDTTTKLIGMCIADTNGLIFKMNTISSSRRVLIIDVGFNKLNNTSYTDSYNMNIANNYLNNVNTEIKTKIEKDEFSLQAFYYCYNNFKKNLSDNRKLKPNFEKNPMNIFSNKFLEPCFLHSLNLKYLNIENRNISELKIIKKDKRENYKVKHVCFDHKKELIIITDVEYLEKLFDKISELLMIPDDTKKNIKIMLKDDKLVQPFILLFDLKSKYYDIYKDYMSNNNKPIDETNEIYTYLSREV